MATKTVLNIVPKVFTSTATGVAATVVAFAAGHFDPAWLDFLPKPEQAPAVAGAIVLLSNLAAWLKKDASDETPNEQAAAADVATAVEDVIPVTFNTAN